MEPFYRPILKKSWEIVRKYKSLWLLGFLAAFLGNSGDLKFFFDLTGNISRQPIIWLNLKDYFLRPAFVNFLQVLGNAPLVNQLIVIIFFIFCLVFFTFIIWLAVSAQAGLINGVNEIENGKITNFSSNFAIGAKFFWPVFGLNLLAKLIAFLSLTVIILPLIIITQNLSTSLLFVVLSFLIFLPLIIILNFVTKYAIAYVVINGKNFSSAFKTGWQLFFNNWLISLEMAVILLIINFIIGFVFIVLALIIISPLFVSILFLFSQNPIILSFIFIFTIFFLLLLLIITAIFITLFQTSSWTILFLRLNKSKFFSKLERLTSFPPLANK